MNNMKREESREVTKTTIYNFDPFNASNIHCIYDTGSNHTNPVYQQCERCLMVNGTITPLCSSCGYHVADMKLCNDCYTAHLDGYEKEWLN